MESHKSWNALGISPVLLLTGVYSGRKNCSDLLHVMMIFYMMIFYLSFTGAHYLKESTRGGGHDLHNFISSGFVTLGRSHAKGNVILYRCLMTNKLKVLKLTVCLIEQWPLTCHDPLMLSSLLVGVTEGCSQRSQSLSFTCTRNERSYRDFHTLLKAFRNQSAPLFRVFHFPWENPVPAFHTALPRIEFTTNLFYFLFVFLWDVQILQPCYPNLGDD